MAKISRGIKDAVQRDLNKRKILKLTIGGDEYEVRIKYTLSPADKTEILQNMSEYVLSKTALSENLTAFTIAAYENITDIDFGETYDDKMEMLGLLASGDYLETITKAIPQKMITELTDFIQKTADLMPALIKKAEIEKASREVELNAALKASKEAYDVVHSKTEVADEPEIADKKQL